MLNLQEMTKTKKLYEIKMPDGTELTLKMPTQAMFQKIMELQDIGKDKPLEALDSIYQMTTDILNLNTQGKTYDVEELKSTLDISICVLVIQDYFQSLTNILGE